MNYDIWDVYLKKYVLNESRYVNNSKKASYQVTK
jgi:hypothetical protein